METDKLGNLVFYAIDKASPRDLALQKATDSLVKIEDLELRDLGIMEEGLSILWTIINGSGPDYAGTGKVSDSEQKKCRTVGDVWKAVGATVHSPKTAKEFL